MNPEIKEQWLKDLRSGEFEQGQEYLSRDGKYCCLGVLCEQAADAGIVTRETYDSLTHGKWVRYIAVDKPEDNDTACLPYAVQHWAGLTRSNPDVTHQGVGDDEPCTWSLAGLNDNGKSFEAIADIIDAQL